MRRKLVIACAVAAVCATAAVATALAATPKTHHASRSATVRRSARSGAKLGEGGAPPAGGPGWPGGPGGPGAVHSEGVVLNKAGTGYITVTSDSGTVKSVEASAGKLTVVEGVKSVTYKTVTLTVPSEAKVTLDGNSSSLADLAEGDHVTVSSSSEGTTVFATDSSFHPEGGPQVHPGPPPGGGAEGGETGYSG